MTAGAVAKGYRLGTHRLVEPEATLERITPLLEDMDITRLADITGLDRLGIPTFCAVRPTARLVQTANGKGLRPNDARVSALMEAIEVFHAENPMLPLTRASLAELRADGRRVVDPSDLPDFGAAAYFHERHVTDWVEAEELHSGARWLVPASAAYPVSPSLYAWWTNGLASGNHIVEATLHAVYEVVERHVMALAVKPDESAMGLLRPRVTYFRLARITSEPVQGLCERIERANLKLQLASVRTPGPLHTFWAILLDPKPLALTTLVNTGYGTHASPTVAAIRAITEAAQSRLSLIHASREDLAEKAAFVDPERMRRSHAFFDGIIGGGDWCFVKDHSCESLSADHDTLLPALASQGFDRIFRVDLTRAGFDIPVVKVIVPGMMFDERMV
jgi:ribosomal protein S12 methylthiotransferase accessory factor